MEAPGRVSYQVGCADAEVLQELRPIVSGRPSGIKGHAAMKVKTKVWTAAFAAMVSIILAIGGVEIVSRTKVGPEAIELSVIHANDAIERAWKLPAATSFRHEVSWQSNASLCGP